MRRVPPELQKYLGNRGYITVLMPQDTYQIKDQQLIEARASSLLFYSNKF